MPTGEHSPDRCRAADLAGVDPELAAMLTDLAATRPAAFEVGAAALRLGTQDPAALEAWLRRQPPPGPDADDDELVAWAHRTDRLREWLAGGEVVTVHPGGLDLRVVES